MKASNFLLLILTITVVSCHRDEIPHTDKTKMLVKELLEKIDNADKYAAKKDAEIHDLKIQLSNTDNKSERFDLQYKIAEKYASYSVDSALVYLRFAAQTAKQCSNDSLKINAEIRRSLILSAGGFYVAAKETLESIPRGSLSNMHLVTYYNAWATLYHELYSSYYEPEEYVKEYRLKYNIYRDSLLTVAEPTDIAYLRNMERKEARAKNFEEARKYNELRLSIIQDKHSTAYATAIYDRYLIASYYEGKVTGEAIDDLILSAIIEVENSSYDIASLFRFESHLSEINKIADAKKVSDHYYSILGRFGSRKRLIEGGEQAILINERTHEELKQKNQELVTSIIFISLLLFALLGSLYIIYRYVMKISKLNEKLQRSGQISKSYVGVVFKLYSSYIKIIDVLRTKVHASLKRGNIEHALELTMPSGEYASEERRLLFQKFDSAFVDIFPDYIDTVNACLKPEDKISPKRTEILNNELRLIALVKLGIEDSKEIADMLHCSLKTVYNLRSSFKARLAIPEDKFNDIIAKL